mmetsp:Transcript_21840/g.55418  ORF Transcript_21840/g.55418 Transcript_21840/m.55418 type:complete len:490 (-) Transcript_21840:14-1483(-)
MVSYMNAAPSVNHKAARAANSTGPDAAGRASRARSISRGWPRSAVMVVLAVVKVCWVGDALVLLLGGDAHVRHRVGLIVVLVLVVVVARRLVERHAGCVVDLAQVLEEALLDLVEVLGRVEVLHIAGGDVQLEVRRVVLEIVVIGQLVLDLFAERDGRLVGPAARDVADGVAAAAEQQRGQIELEHEVDALGVSLDREVEAAEPVARQRVGAALQHHGVGLIGVDDALDDRLKDVLVRHVVDAVTQREVDRVVLSLPRAHVLHVARAGEVLAELVERDGHHAVGGVEGLLDTVAVVDVDVDVQHALVVLEQLQDRQHDVVHVAEARRLTLLRVVQPPRPVDRNVGLLPVQLDRAADRAACRDLEELVHAVEDRAVLAHIEALQLLGVVGHVVGGDHFEEGGVLLGVEAADLVVLGVHRAIDLHLLVEPIVEQQVVRHPNAVGLHRVPLPIVEVANLGVIEVADLLLPAHAASTASVGLGRPSKFAGSLA